MVDFRKLKALTPAQHAAQEDGRRAQGPERVGLYLAALASGLSTVSNSLPRFASWRGVPIGLDFLRNISLAIYN